MPDMMFQALDLTGLGETAEQVRAIAQGIKDEIDAELDSLDFAQPDGIYPEMTVGAVIGADETAQWAQRESTGSGSATIRSVQGAAVAFRQRYNYNKRPSTVITGIDVVNNDDGSITLTGTATADVSLRWNYNDNYIILSGHKYLEKFCPSGGSANTYYAYDAWATRFNYDTGAGLIFTANADTSLQPVLKIANGAAINGTVYPQFFDLTQMFGSGNEPTTVAEFEAMYPLPYYPYSAPTLKPVRIAGVAITDANGDALDSVEWPTQTLRAAGSVADMLYSDHVDVRVGVVDLGTLTWRYISDNVFSATLNDLVRNASNRLACAAYTPMDATYPNDSYAVSGLNDKSVATSNHLPTNGKIFLKDTAYTDPNTLKASLSGILCFYQLATPTTTPISPALPMTYRVQQGGTESIIVPEGEISAAPVLTVADPVNMSTELARIWAAIEALQSNSDSALGSVRSDSDVSSTEVKEAPTMDEKQTTERESEV